MKKIILLLVAIILILVSCTNKNINQDSQVTSSDNKEVNSSYLDEESDVKEHGKVEQNTHIEDSELMQKKKISMVTFRAPSGIDVIKKGFVDACENIGIDYELIDILEKDRDIRIEEFKEYAQQAEISGMCFRGDVGGNLEEYYPYLVNRKYTWLNYFDPDNRYDINAEDVDITAMLPSYTDHVEEVITYLQHTYSSTASIGVVFFGGDVDFRVLLEREIQKLYPNSPEVISYEEFLADPEEYLSKVDVVYCNMPDILQLLLDMNCEQEIIYGSTAHDPNYIEILDSVADGRVSAVIQEYDRYEMGYLAAIYLAGFEVPEDNSYSLSPITISTPAQVQHMKECLE